MGISVDASFDIAKPYLDLKQLKEKVIENPILNDSFIPKLIDVESNCINSFTDEKFILELQDEFFSLIQLCLIGDGEVVVEVECIDDGSKEIYTITKDNILEEEAEDDDNEEEIYYPKDLEVGMMYECTEYDFFGKPHDIELRNFLSFSVNDGYAFKVEKIDDKGVHFIPYKDSVECLVIPYELHAEFVLQE